jgi:hypothetical protein
VSRLPAATRKRRGPRARLVSLAPGVTIPSITATTRVAASRPQTGGPRRPRS